MGDDKKLGKSIAWVKHLFGFWLANALISNLSTINLNFFQRCCDIKILEEIQQTEIKMKKDKALSGL